jgi:hypothetical protein
MVVSGNKVAAVAGDEDFAGCNVESGPTDHTCWGLVVHKKESALHKRDLPWHSEPSLA